MSSTNMPGIVEAAPHLAELIGQSLTPPDHDRAQGVLLGLAVGNLLGLPIEGFSRSSIELRYPDGISEIDPGERQLPMDDDLAQAVDLAEALAHDADPLAGFAERLVRWRRENGRGIGIMTSALIDLLEDGRGVPDVARTYWLGQGSPPTQPNGALMRCASVALCHSTNPAALIRESAATCAVTHYAPGAQWSCIIVNAALAVLLHGGTVRRDALAQAALQDGAPTEVAEWIDAIPGVIEGRIEAERMIGHTYLCMQAALWCLDTDDGFEDALVRIVNAGGDTDTNGAVAGAVLGARFGASAIPQRWLDCVSDRERIDAATEALLARQ